MGYEWGVTSAEVLAAAGHPAPSSPTLPSATAMGGYITRASARVNARYKQYTGLTAATGLDTSDEEAYQLGRTIVIHLAAAEWLFGNQGDHQEFAAALLEMAQGADGRGGELADLRFLLTSARTALAPTTGPPRTDGASEAPKSWVDPADVGSREPFG